MTVNLFFGYMSPTKFNFIVSAAIFASTIYFLWMKFKKNSRVTRKDDLIDGSRKQETDVKNDSVLIQDILNGDKNENSIMAITDICKNSDLEKVITKEFEEIRKMISVDKNQTEIIDSNCVSILKSNSNGFLSDFNEKIESLTIDDSLEGLCEKLESININSTINHEILLDEITDVTTDIEKNNNTLILGTEEVLVEERLDVFQELNDSNHYNINDMKIDIENNLRKEESDSIINICQNVDDIYQIDSGKIEKNNLVEELESHIESGNQNKCKNGKSNDTDEGEVEIADKILTDHNSEKIYNQNNMGIEQRQKVEETFAEIQEYCDIDKHVNIQIIKNYCAVEEKENGEIVNESFMNEGLEKTPGNVDLDMDLFVLSDRVENVENSEVEFLNDRYQNDEVRNLNVGNIEKINGIEEIEEGEIIDESFIEKIDSLKLLEKVEDKSVGEIKENLFEEILGHTEKELNIAEVEEEEIIDESFIDGNLDNNRSYIVDIKVDIEHTRIVNETIEEIIELCEEDQIINIEKIENLVQDEEREDGEIVDESFDEKSENVEENKDTDLNVELIEKVNECLDLRSNSLEDLQEQFDIDHLVNNEKIGMLCEVVKENSEKLNDAEIKEEQNKDHKNTYRMTEVLIESNEYLKKESEVVNEISEKIHVYNDVDHFLNEKTDNQEQLIVDYIDKNLDLTTEKVDLDLCHEILKMEELGIFLHEYCDKSDEQNSPIKENQFCNLNLINEFDKDINEDYKNSYDKDNQSSKQDIDSSSDSQESDYLHDSPLDGLIAECLNGKESDCNSLSNQVDDTELFGKHENWPNDEDSLNNIKRDFYDMQINICSPNSSSESDHAHCMNNLTERVAILSAESILDGRAQANSSDSEMTTTISSTSREDCSPELYVEKITCGGKEVDVVYFDEAVLEEGGVQTDAKIVRTIPVGLGGRIIGKKGKTKNELMKKFGAKLLIYNHPIEMGMQVLEITCKPSISEEMESWVNKTLEQITKTTVQTTVSNPEWLKPMIPLGKMVAAHIIDMSTMEHVKLRIYEPEIIKKFNKMQVEMNADYGNVDNSALLPRPVAVGCVCVAMIRPDYFLRAQIIEIYDDIVWVYLFDIGKVCQTYLFYLFKIREKYMRVPFQVIPARLPHALLKNNSITSDIIYKRFLLDPITKKPKMVRVFFPRMNSCCVPCANIYIPMSVVDSESKNSEEFVDLLELLVSIDVCTMVRETINSEFQMEINKNHFRNFLNDKQRKQLANSQVPVYFQPCNGKFYEDFIDFQMGNDKNV